MKNENNDISYSYFHDLLDLDIKKCLGKKRFKIFDNPLNQSPSKSQSVSYFAMLDSINLHDINFCRKSYIKEILNSTSSSPFIFQEMKEITKLENIELYKHNIKKPSYSNIVNLKKDHTETDKTQKLKYSNSDITTLESIPRRWKNAPNNNISSEKKIRKISDNKSLDYLIEQLLNPSSNNI